MTLPLQNGAFFVDNSFLEQLQQCPTMLKYNQIERRVLASSKPSLNFGSALHLALEHRYRNFGTDLQDLLVKSDCESQQAELLARFFSENPAPEDEYRNLNWAMELVKQYNNRYPIEPFNLLSDAEGKPLVELTFAVPFLAVDKETFEVRIITSLKDLRPNEFALIYCGKVDLPILWDSHLFTMDHKTTSRLGDSFWEEQKVSPQHFGYCWAFKRLLGQQPLGFVINAIRTKEMAAKPKGGAAAFWEETFQRNKEYISVDGWQFDEWEKNTIALIEEFFFYLKKGYFPMKRKWCMGKYGKCQYYEVDYAPPHQRMEYLQSSAFEDYTWSPLKKIGEK